MSPPTLRSPPATVPLALQPLTRAAFARFGTAIENPGGAAESANQGTAQKHARIAPVTAAYPPAAPRASQNLNLFSCAPRALPASGVFAVTILERHPYTPQTFIPLALSVAPDAPSFYVVIVAPTCARTGMPRLAELAAFRCHGGQAVTYAAGTWHAPMVVVGAARVDFCVLVAENGVPDDDCQEVLIGGGGVGVKVLEPSWGLWQKPASRL